MSETGATARATSAGPTSRQSQGARRDTMLHLVGRITETVYSFLGPATDTLADQGVGQTLVLLDDSRYRHLLARFDPSVRLVLINASLPLRKRNAALLEAYCRTVQLTQPTAAHLHGAGCLLLGLYASRARRAVLPTFFTPHGSSTLAPLRFLRRLFVRRVRPRWGSLAERIIASSGTEARQLRDAMTSEVHLVESIVNTLMFEVVPNPDLIPVVIAGHRAKNAIGSAQFVQCAVLLVDQMPELSFDWIGPADRKSAEQMLAAGVAQFEQNDDELRAHHLARAWVFVAPDGVAGFPVPLAEAMALGLACVAWDTPNHRDLIEHGVTGYLCEGAEDAIEYMAELLESPSLRKRIGEAARVEARRRFNTDRFRAALLGIYGGVVSR